MKMTELKTVKMTHEDGWGYIINFFEDVTEVVYFEIVNGQQETVKSMTIPTELDVDICKTIIKIRELDQE